MEVYNNYTYIHRLNTNETLLTDFEVKEVLIQRNAQKDNQRDRKQPQSSTMWITRSVLRYLGEKPSNNYTPEMYFFMWRKPRISKFLDDLNNFKDEKNRKIMLTKAEILMIINNCPISEVLIHCVWK